MAWNKSMTHWFAPGENTTRKQQLAVQFTVAMEWTLLYEHFISQHQYSSADYFTPIEKNNKKTNKITSKLQAKPNRTLRNGELVLLNSAWFARPVHFTLYKVIVYRDLRPANSRPRGRRTEVFQKRNNMTFPLLRARQLIETRGSLSSDQNEYVLLPSFMHNLQTYVLQSESKNILYSSF
jgi:hypothetical protein